MAAFSSVQSGDFDDTNTWDLAGFPGPTDTFTINANHTVTVPNGVTANSSGNLQGTSTSTRAVLTVDFGGTFQQSGDVLLDPYNQLNMAGAWDQNGFDLLTTNTSQGRNVVNFVGTVSNRAKVISSVAATGVIGRQGATDSMVGLIAVNYCDFVDAGNVRLGRNFNAEGFRLENATFTRCNEFRWGGFHNSNGDFVIRNVDVRDSASGTSNVGIIERQRGSDGGEAGGGEIYIGDITMDKGTGPAVLRDEIDYIPLNGNIILSEIVFSTVLSTQHTQNEVLLYSTDPSGLGSIDSGGSALKNRWYVWTATNNPHVLFDNTDAYTDLVIENSYEGVTITDRGDAWNISQFKNQSVTGVLLLERQGGVFANALGSNKNFNYTYHHNTIVANGTDPAYGHIFRTETGGSSAGGDFDMQSNLCVNTNADTTNRAINIDGATTGDIETMDYNCYFGYGANIYFGVTHPTKTVGDPGYGGNDLTVDPQFFDDTRDFANFGGQIGESQTSAAVIAHFLRINGYNSGSETQVPAEVETTTVADLLDWVRDGYRVQNQTLEDAGHDGVTIGALSYIEPSNGGGGVPKTKFRRFPWQPYNPL